MYHFISPNYPFLQLKEIKFENGNVYVETEELANILRKQPSVWGIKEIEVPKETEVKEGDTNESEESTGDYYRDGEDERTNTRGRKPSKKANT